MTENPLRLIPEHYERSAEVQSQSQNLVPRKCWLRMTQLLVKPALLEKNQKMRLIVRIPNSNKSVKTQKLSFDDNVIKYLTSQQNSAGFSNVPIDVTIIYEYNHDVQVDHPPVMAIELETISSILGRSKSIGIVAVNMSDVIQMNMKNAFQMQKDGVIAAILTAEIHSLCLTKTIPLSTTKSMSVFSDSDSEFVSESVVITEAMIQQMIKDRKVLFLDETTHEGQVLKQGLSVKDFIIPAKNNVLVQTFLNIAAQSFPYSSPIFIVLAGDDYFVSMVLKEMIAYRDRGLITLDVFSIFVLPLSQNHSRIAQTIGKKSPRYETAFLKPSWLSIFPEDSAVQNVGPQIGAAVDSIFKSELNQVVIPSADALITTATDSYVLPMFVGVSIGDSGMLTSSRPTENAIQMKCTFVQSKAKTNLLKFHYLTANLNSVGLIVRWKQLTNSNIIPMIQSFDKFSVEEESEKCNKFAFSLPKTQNSLDIVLDGVTIKGIMGLNITLRDSESSVAVSSLA